jgi:hypothetical protein
VAPCCILEKGAERGGSETSRGIRLERVDQERLPMQGPGSQYRQLLVSAPGGALASIRCSIFGACIWM